jgi:long-chain fatty acid transport protein
MTRTRYRMPLLVGVLLASLVCLAPARSARAAGFFLPEQSAEAFGRSSAVVASISDPSAVWYNPAALSYMPGFQVAAGGILYLVDAKFSPLDGSPSVSANPMRLPIPSFFATGRVSDRVGVGLGAFVPFGLASGWPDSPTRFVGRENGIKAAITVLNINPVVSVKLLPNLSLGAGLDVMRGAVDITQGLPDAIGGGSVSIGGTSWGFGGNVGLLYRAMPEKLHLAAAYHSRVKLDFAGRAHFVVNEPVFTSTLFDQAGSAKITLPDFIQFGVMVRPHRRVTLELDTNVILWNTYKKIPIDFADPKTPDSALYPNFSPNVSVRLGVDWKTPVKGLHARAGFIFDQGAAPKAGESPLMPDASALDLCLGAGYTFTRWLKVDLAYMLVGYLPAVARHPTDTTTPAQSPEGHYNVLAHLLGLTVTYRYGQPRHEPHSHSPAPTEPTASSPPR